jgi:BON domain-containing protein
MDPRTPPYGNGPELERGPGAPEVRRRYDDVFDGAYERRAGAVEETGRRTPRWRRSDDRLCEDVNAALARDPGLDAGDIEVRVQDSDVTLMGAVADKFARQLAEDIAESVFGVTSVQNLLTVKRDGDGMEASSGRRGDREVKLSAQREGGPAPSPPPTSRKKKMPPGSPETLAD